MTTSVPGSDEAGRSRSRSAALDGIRAIAVTAVVYRHLAGPGLVGGGNGVLIFFTLSGFIITYLLCVEHERTGRVDLGAFWRRRARRLLPALGLCIALSIGTQALTGGGALTTARQAVPVLLFVSNWWRVWIVDRPGSLGLGPFDHTWSLSIEEQFYLAWPLLFLLLLRYLGRRPPVVAWAIVGVAELSALVRAASWNDANPARSLELIYNRTDTEAELLLVGAAAGVLTWVLTKDVGPRPRLPSWLLPVSGGVGGLTVLAALFGQPGANQPERMQLFWTVGVSVLAFGVAALCVHVLVNPTALLPRALAVAPLPQLGRLSYGVYLYHFPLLLFVYPGFVDRPVLGAAVTVAATLAVSVASWRWVERPVLSWNRRRPVGATRG